jgi:flagellar biosynthesis/type III secretory pathway protein FliH
LSADSPKHNAASCNESCALYYFPEISAGADRNRSATTAESGQFVGSVPAAGRRPQRQDADDAASKELAARLEAAFSQGLVQGRKEAVAAQQAAAKNAVEAFRTAVEEMIRVRRQDSEQMEREAVRLALAIAGKIIGNACENGTAIGHVVRQALQQVPDPRQLVVRLNPKDIDNIDMMEVAQLSVEDADAHVRVQPDETIQQGGCIVETRLGDVDARIAQQIRIIEDRLTAQLPPGPAES